MDTDRLLKSFELCRLAGFWDRDWERGGITLDNLLGEGIKAGVTSDRKRFNEVAGETVMDIASQRDILADTNDVYGTSLHTACMADVISMALRRPSEAPWRVPESLAIGSHTWTPGCFLNESETVLRRFVTVTAWSDARHYEEARSWASIGPVALYNLPIKIGVIVLGQMRNGKRSGYWSRGYLHPKNRKLRLKRKNFIGKGFSETWIEIFREDRDNISSEEWLAQMAEDEVLRDCAFSVTVDPLSSPERTRILDLAKRLLDEIYSLTEQPIPQLTGCFWPIPCSHASHCHKNILPSEKSGFVRIT